MADQDTKRPWTSSKEAHPRLDGLVGYRIRNTDGAIIAEIFPRTYPVVVDAGIAQLISAAPDMLIACKLAFDRLNKKANTCKNCEWKAADQDAWTALKRAIEKAEEAAANA